MCNWEPLIRPTKTLEGWQSLAQRGKRRPLAGLDLSMKSDV